MSEAGKSTRRATGRPRREDVADIEAAIQRAAIEALLQKGEATTMNDVVLASGLSRKSIYARYSNKSELFVDAVRNMLARSLTIDIPAEGNAEARLRSYLEAALLIIATPQSRAIQRLLAFNPAFVGELNAELRSAMERRFVAPLSAFLALAAKTGELTVTDPDAAARAIVNLIHSESLIPAIDRGGPSEQHWLEEHARFLAELFARGMLSR